MPQLIFIRFVAFLSLLAACGSVMAQATAVADGVRLEWKFEPGSKVNVEMKQSMTMDMEVGGQKMNTTSNTTTWMGWEVKGFDAEGLPEIVMTATRVKLDMDAPMFGKVAYDSDTEEEPTGMAAQMAASFQPLIGVPVKQKMNSQGKIVDVEIPEAALEGMKSGPMGDSKQMFVQLTKNASLAFPDKPLQVGTTWTSESEMKSPAGMLAVTNEYTYAGLQDVDGKQLHKIDAKMKLEIKGESSNPLIGEIEVKDQTTTGALYFDASAGRLDHSEVTQDMTMLLKVQGQEITQKMVQEVRVDFSPVE